MSQDYKDKFGAMDFVINEMRKLSLADIRSASRNERDEFERVASGIVKTIREENAHDRADYIAQCQSD